ncbi:phage major capsid protein [Devosia naphthalenivorans]|uniref:phage major capsid protein n=1 Tax=Devosia naphthalenivorans TaxID=2082392 RepID=UPI000D34D2A6|nr:phage major capsid protein [Devosia naphthalenivorans]
MDMNALATAFEQNHAATTAALADLKKELGEVHDLRDSLDQIEARLNRPGNGGVGNRVSGDLKAEYAAIGSFARTGDLDDIKALSVADDPGGGYFVHPALSDTMSKKIFDSSPLRKLVRVVQIGDGGSFEEPIDHDEVGAEWVGEEEARPETKAPKIGLLTIPLMESYSLQVVTQRLLHDAGFDVGEWIVSKMVDKFGRADGRAFTTGDGHKKPTGFLSYPTNAEGDFERASATLQHVWSGGATTITADAVKDVYWALRSDHRQNATWVMSSATANRIDRLKDGAGNYLWRAGMTAGAPNELLGKPVEFSEDMPGVGAGTLPIAFADWQRGYTAIERPGLKFLRDPYSSKPHVVFYAYRRVGGAVSNTDAIKLVKIGTGE